jgi:hypothetical protein
VNFDAIMTLDVGALQHNIITVRKTAQDIKKNPSMRAVTFCSVQTLKSEKWHMARNGSCYIFLNFWSILNGSNINFRRFCGIHGRLCSQNFC